MHHRSARVVSRRVRRVLQRARAGGLAGAPGIESVGGRHPGGRRLRIRQGQARGSDYDRILHQRRSRHGGRGPPPRKNPPPHPPPRAAAPRGRPAPPAPPPPPPPPPP